ncbi:uncharacterized protein LOC103515842 [Diaphorina citri]|uniref:Uncharacterized protein LOC103515842 n=1 Tax=Diaphorina citri TaxID=121845 RepID=A0A3Q0J6Z6_DIACI|nr:uncharacterized protein LOC103515842 [Diaphorina citri]
MSLTNQIINGAYFRLVAKCLFEPYSYHLNSEQLKELKWIMDRVLCDKCRSVDEIAKPLFEIIYRDYIQVDKMLEQIMEPYRMRQNRVDASQRFYLEAVMLIQKSGLFPYYIECINSDMVDLMVLTLFESSQEYAELSVDIAQYSRLVLEFISANSPDMRKLFECLVDEEMCSTFSSRPITKGSHFFNLHRPMLTQLLFRSHPDQLASLLLTEISDQKLSILTHLVQTLTGPKRDLDNTVTLLSNSGAAGVFFKTAVLSHWSRLVAYGRADDQWLSMLSNITHVKSHAGYLAEFDQVAEWFCQRLESPLLGPPDLLHYLKLLPSFLPNDVQ